MAVGSYQETGAVQGLSLEPSSQVPCQGGGPRASRGIAAGKDPAGLLKAYLEMIKVLIMHMRQRPDASC